jgi:hypothetical protein
MTIDMTDEDRRVRRSLERKLAKEREEGGWFWEDVGFNKALTAVRKHVNKMTIGQIIDRLSKDDKEKEVRLVGDRLFNEVRKEVVLILRKVKSSHKEADD